MRPDLRRISHGLNDVGLELAKRFIEELAHRPEYARLAPPLDAPFTIVPKTAPTPTPTRTLASRAREPYFLVDRRLDVIAVSTALQRILGSSAQDLLGQRWQRVVDGADELRLIHQKWLISAQTHRGFTHTTRCRTAAGAIVFLFMRVEPYETPGTRAFGGFFGTVRIQTLPLTLLYSQEQSA